MTRLTANQLLMLRAAGPQAAQLIAYEQVMQQSRELRAEAFHDGVAKVGSAFSRVTKSLAAGVARARTRRRALDQLHRLDDRMLRDIGLERGNLEEAVDATLEQRAPSWSLESFSLASLGQAVIAPLVRWQRKAATLGELSQLDDHLLADIGISRGDLRHAPERVLEQAAANRNQAPKAA